MNLLLERLDQAGYPGVRPSHGYVIQQLVEGEPTITELAAALGMTQQGASKQVKDLESLGYAERVGSPADQRIKHVRPTARGLGVLTETRRLRTELEAALVSSLGADAVRSAKEVLSELLSTAGLTPRIRTRSVPLPRRSQKTVPPERGGISPSTGPYKSVATSYLTASCPFPSRAVYQLESELGRVVERLGVDPDGGDRRRDRQGQDEIPSRRTTTPRPGSCPPSLSLTAAEEPGPAR